MILLISVCNEEIHKFEFVRPIENILNKNKLAFTTKNYMEVKKEDLELADKIIISGTSLDDNEFLNNIKKFFWIKKLNKPILGICAGMQIISLVYGSKIGKKQEIGYFRENFTKEFLGLNESQEVYHLHNNYTTLPKNFISFTDGKIPQAIKHKTKEIYGVLFHPEVRKEILIEEFTKH